MSLRKLFGLRENTKSRAYRARRAAEASDELLLVRRSFTAL